MILSLKLLIPEIFLSAIALLLLGVDAFFAERQKRWAMFISLVSLVFALFLVVSNDFSGRAFNMFVSDGFSVFFKLVAIFGAMLVVLMSEKDDELMGKNAGTYSALIILSTVGVMLLASSEDLLMVFLGMELATVPLFILSGFLRNNMRSSEGAIKFFLVGAFSTGIMIYGISLLYGVCGSTRFSVLRDWLIFSFEEGNALFLLAIILFFVGIGFKLTLVPFHQWTPDAYEGAPTPITAFFSVSRDAGVLAVALRFFSEFANTGCLGLTDLFMLLSILTMTVANITALSQNNLKRLLAYSSIAHAGNIFIGIVAGTMLGREGAMLYVLAYLFMNMGAFSVVTIISRFKGSVDLESVQGLAKENLSLAMLMLFFLFSLAGIPPFLGFWGKFYVFSAAIGVKMYWLVAIALLNAVIAVYYYFRIIHKMFFQNPSEKFASMPERIGQPGIQIAVGFCACVIIFLGVYPQQALAWIKDMANMLP